MSEIFDDSNRQIMPRWYPFNTAISLGDIDDVSQSGHVNKWKNEEFENKIFEWRKKKTLACAIDLVGTSLIVGGSAGSDEKEAAKFILNGPHNTSLLSTEIANAFNLGYRQPGKLEIQTNIEDCDHGSNISKLKKLLKEYPRSAIYWADKSFYYALLGQKKKSESSMDIAISMGLNNRFILRCASRCFLHLDKPEKALFYLRKSDLSRFDPWIVSAEVAISEGIKQKSMLVKTGRKLINNSNLTPWSTNELAATLSTIEASYGSQRKSKKLMMMALVEPNENTVAQAEWLSNVKGLEVARPKKEITALFEADAMLNFRNGEFAESLKFAKRWFNFQPFSSRPAILASYIASICLKNDKEAVEIIESARASCHDSFLLRNNLVFSLASLDRLDEAQNILDQNDFRELDEMSTYVNLATCGLVQFRKKNLEEGRNLYKQAISGFTKLRYKRGVAMATLFLAREEALLGSKAQFVLLKEAISLARKGNMKEVLLYAESLESHNQHLDKD